jgi:hypothetical protein
MPIRSWDRVDAGVFHHFQLAWVGAIARELNAGILSADYYAMVESHAAESGANLLTLDAPTFERDSGQTGTETETKLYCRKQNTVTVRHASGDRIVSVVEIVSPGQ